MSPKRGGEPRRKRSAAPVRRSILIFTEGSKTEPIYLTQWYRLYREQVIVKVDDFHGAPLRLVEQAVAQKKSDQRTQRRGQGDAYSEYWCVFDVDEHPHVARALALAAAHEINVAVSNPCIELWFVLHFQDQNAAIERGEAQRKSSGLLHCSKVPTAEALTGLVSRYAIARSRAMALDRKHELDGSPHGSNPSSGAWQLIDRIRGDRDQR